MACHCIVGIGEILWDIFPDGPRFGGAPCNYCCTVAELSRDADVAMVSSVGDDHLGLQARQALHCHNVKTECVQEAAQPTGTVDVQIDNDGIASYSFASDCAWDDLVWTDVLQQRAADCDAVCFGTLGQRSPQSRSVIQQFIKTTKPETLRILDVNIRAPYCDEEVILQSLKLANVLKLNDEEFPELLRINGIAQTGTQALQQLAQQHQLESIALTRGAEGAILMHGDQVSDLRGRSVDVADTVGAGDAYTAAMTLGMLQGKSVVEINQKAIAAASYVCSHAGATPAFPPEMMDA